jgi:FMN phosphatase YigB (HAD superfamily)
MDSVTTEKDVEAVVKPEILLMDLGNVIIYSKEGLPGGLNKRNHELVKTKGPEYPFFDYFDVRKKMTDLLGSIKGKHEIYLVAKGVIQNNLKLRKVLQQVFDYSKIISMSGLGLSKQSPEAYKRIVARLKVNAPKILFVDDNIENIKAAKGVGLQTIHFESEDQTVAEIKAKLGLT